MGERGRSLSDYSQRDGGRLEGGLLGEKKDGKCMSGAEAWIVWKMSPTKREMRWQMQAGVCSKQVLRSRRFHQLKTSKSTKHIVEASGLFHGLRRG